MSQTKAEQLEMYMETNIGAFKDKLEKQTSKGDKKYGQLPDPLDDYDWNDMAEDELVDGFVYIQMQKAKVEIIAAKLRKLTSYRQTEQTQMEIRYWLNKLDGKE